MLEGREPSPVRRFFIVGKLIKSGPDYFPVIFLGGFGRGGGPGGGPDGCQKRKKPRAG